MIPTPVDADTLALAESVLQAREAHAVERNSIMAAVAQQRREEQSAEDVKAMQSAVKILSARPAAFLGTEAEKTVKRAVSAAENIRRQHDFYNEFLQSDTAAKINEGKKL